MPVTIPLPLNNQDKKQLLEQITAAKHIVITAHQNPDGDAVGSVLGLYHLLCNVGKNGVCILPDMPPPFLAWMSGAKDMVYYDSEKQKAQEALNNADLIFCLDYNAPDRTGKEMGESIQKAKAFKVMIDHHPMPAAFCDVTLNFPQDGSTCQLVYRFAVTLELEKHIDEHVAACLYTGIMTDSGSFRYPSTTALTHTVAARLIEAGAPNGQIHVNVFDTNTESKLKLMGYALTEKLVVLPQYAVAYITLTEKELQKFNYQKGDTEGLVNYGLSIEGIKMAAIFMEKDGMVKISFRSKGNVPVNEFMQANFSGGGHKNAAGGRSNKTLDVTIQQFLSLIPTFMQHYKNA